MSSLLPKKYIFAYAIKNKHFLFSLFWSLEDPVCRYRVSDLFVLLSKGQV